MGFPLPVRSEVNTLANGKLSLVAGIVIDVGIVSHMNDPVPSIVIDGFGKGKRTSVDSEALCRCSELGICNVCLGNSSKAGRVALPASSGFISASGGILVHDDRVSDVNFCHGFGNNGDEGSGHL